MINIVNLKVFGKALKRIKTNNQLDLFITLGTEKEFAPGDKRKLQVTRSGKKRWMDADEKKKAAKKNKLITEDEHIEELKVFNDKIIKILNDVHAQKITNDEYLDQRRKLVKQKQEAIERYEKQRQIKQPYEMSKQEFNKLPKFKQNIKAENFGLEKDMFKKLMPGDQYTRGFYSKDRDLHKDIVQQAIKEGKIKSHPDYPELTQKKEEEINPEEILKELKIKVWHRGVNKSNEKEVDKFYSASKEVASNYSMSTNSDERRYEELKTDSPDFPKNPMVLGSKYDLAYVIGFNEDPYQQRKFDDIAKKNAQGKGYDAIIYLDGTFEEPELHLFGKVEEEPTPEKWIEEQIKKYEKPQKFSIKPTQKNPLLPVEIKFIPTRYREEKNRVKAIAVGVNGEEENASSSDIGAVVGRPFFQNETDRIPYTRLKLWLDGLISENDAQVEGDNRKSLRRTYYRIFRKSMSTLKIFGKEVYPGTLSYKGLSMIKAFGQQMGLFNSGPYSREGQTKPGKGGTLQLKRDKSGKGAHWQLLDKKQPGQQNASPGPADSKASIAPQPEPMKMINTGKAYELLSSKLGASLSINDKTGAQIDAGNLQLINENRDNTISLFYKDKNGTTQIINAPANQAVTQKSNSVNFHFADRDISVELNKPADAVTQAPAETKLPTEQAKESSKIAEATRKVDELLKEADFQRDEFLADLDSIAKENGLQPKSADFRKVSLKNKDEFIKDYLDDDGIVNDMLQGAIVTDSMDKYSSIVSGLKKEGYKIINEDELKNSETMNYKSIKVKFGDDDEVVKEVVVANEAMYKAMIESRLGPNYHRETLYSLDYKVEAEKIPELKTIKEKIYAGTKSGKKELIITGGLAGSGKSTAIEKRHYKNKVYIDPDDMKNKLFADERGVSKDDIRKNPAKYHEESSVLGKHLIREAIRDGRDAFYDATMKGMQNIDDLIKFAKSNGYKVKAKFIHIPLEEGIKRDKARGEAGGRSLGENLYRKLYSGYPTHKVFFDLQNKFDHVELIDNSQAKGEKPKVIQRINEGKVTKVRKRKLDEVKKLVGLIKGLMLTLFKAQVPFNANDMFDKNVKDDYIAGAKETERTNKMKDEKMKTEGMEEKIDPRLFTLLEIEDDGNFDPDEHSMMLGLLEENGLITHDLKLTPEGEKAYEKELAEAEEEEDA